MTGCGDYVATRYIADLDRFRSAYARVLARNPADLPMRAPKLVHVLEGHSDGIARAIDDAGIEDRLRFVIALFLEGTFAAGVHAYDRLRHERYRTALPFEVMIENYPNLTVRHPQALLAARTSWSADDLRLLEECVCDLAQRWGFAYDALIANEQGAGRKIISALSHDVDLAWGAPAYVPERVASAYMSGLRRASRAA